jgi:hypothetical protein
VGWANPFPEAKRVAVIVISPDDGAWVDGVRAERLEDIRDALAVRGGSARDADGASLLHVVIVADERVAWGVVLWMMQVATDECVASRHVHFAVRHRSSCERGVISMNLPVDRGLRATPQTAEIIPVSRVSAFAVDRGDRSASSVDALAEAVAQRVSILPDSVVLFETPPPYGSRVPCGIALRVLDALQRSTSRVGLGGPAPPFPKWEYVSESLTELIRERRASDTVVVLKLRDGTVDLDDLESTSDGTVGPNDPATPMPDGPPPSAIAPALMRVLETPELPMIQDD